MRIGLSYWMAVSIMVANCRSFFLPKPTLPGLMRYFASARAIGIFVQQQMAVVVEVADERDLAAHRVQHVADASDLRRRLLGVDGHAHELGARLRQLLHLFYRRDGVSGVGIGHGLHHDRRAPTHLYCSDSDTDAVTTMS